MYSDIVKKGVEKTPHRSLFKAAGFTDEEIKRPLIGVVSAKNEVIPGELWECRTPAGYISTK